MAEGGEEIAVVDDTEGPNSISFPPKSEDVLEYGDFHKLVLQGIMSAGFLDIKGVKRLFVGTCSYLGMDLDRTTNLQFVQKIVLGINDKIKQFDMAIKSACCELTGKKFYMFLLTVEKPIMRMQNMFSKFQIDHFQLVMDTILRKYNSFSVPLTECSNLSLDLDPRTNLELAEKFVIRMIQQNYFAKMTFETTSDEFNVTLGFRGIREFEPILREQYDEVLSSCCYCKAILLHGLACPNCDHHVHRHCYAKLKLGTRICPMCGASWEEQICMKPRVRNRTFSHDSYEVAPETSRDGATYITKLRIRAEDENERNPEDMADVENAVEENTHDIIGGETDGVVTRESDNDVDSTEEEVMNTRSRKKVYRPISRLSESSSESSG